MIGTIKKFFPDRGFGFIQRDDRAPDVFVHVRDIEQSGLGELREGDRVSFELEADRRGDRMRAVDLRLLEKSSAA